MKGTVLWYVLKIFEKNLQLHNHCSFHTEFSTLKIGKYLQK